MGLWDVVKDGAEVVGDALKEGADAVEDIGDGAGSWIADELCATGNDVLCGAGSVMGGLVSGELGFVGGIIRAGDQIWIAGTSAIGDSLQGRWRDALDDFEALVLAGAVLGVELPGWLLGPIDESIRHWQRNQLRKFVSGLIDTKYRDVPSQRAAVRTATGVDNRPWGMEVSATHRLLAFDSFNLPLDALHDNGVINLYDLAGIEYEKRKNQPEARVLAAHGPNLDPTNLAGRDDIDSYLNTGTPGLKILAMSPKNAARSTPYATRICEDVGILIDWRDTEFAELTVTSLDGDSPRFPVIWTTGTAQGEFLIGEGFRDGTLATECTIAAFGTLDIVVGSTRYRGLTSGLDIIDNPTSCETPERDDACCVTIQPRNQQQGVEGGVRGSSVAYLWPRNGAALATNRFILAHEIGHWLGLCHEGHRRFTEIMYTAERYSVFKAPLTFTILSRSAQRPRFTGKDGQNLWRSILDQRAGRCFAVSPEPDVE
jgi:hypothetical protein